MKLNWKKWIYILGIIAIILSGITLYLYNQTYKNVLKTEKKEQETAYDNHSITKIINRTIIVDEDSVRKDIIFFFKANKSKEDQEYVYSCLLENFSYNETDDITVTRDKEDGENIIRIVFYNENLEILNRLLKKSLGEQNIIQYKYDAESNYKGQSDFFETTDISKIVEFFEYTGDLRYEVHGYKDENIGNLKIDNKIINIEGYVYKGAGKENMQISYQGKYVNYWSVERKIEHLLGYILAGVLVIVAFKRKGNI